MHINVMTPDELIRQVDNDPNATPRERVLAESLNAALNEPYKQRTINPNQLELQFAEVFNTTAQRWMTPK